jgi:hypothetical protein
LSARTAISRDRRNYFNKIIYHCSIEVYSNFSELIFSYYTIAEFRKQSPIIYSYIIFLTAILRNLLANNIIFPYIIFCFSLRTISALFNGSKKSIFLIIISAVKEDLGRDLKISEKEERRYIASETKIWSNFKFIDWTIVSNAIIRFSNILSRSETESSTSV